MERGFINFCFCLFIFHGNGERIPYPRGFWLIGSNVSVEFAALFLFGQRLRIWRREYGYWLMRHLYGRLLLIIDRIRPIQRRISILRNKLMIGVRVHVRRRYGIQVHHVWISLVLVTTTIRHLLRVAIGWHWGLHPGSIRLHHRSIRLHHR
jgi:hypothetical protein